MPLYAKLGLAAAILVALLGLAAWGYKQRGDRIAAEAALATMTAQRDQAIGVARANEDALEQFRDLARRHDEELQQRLADANRRVAAAREVKGRISNVGSDQVVGAGVAAALRSRVRPATGSGDAASP